MARDEAAQSIAGSRIVNGERLDRAENAADENESRRAVEHDAESTDVRSEHAVVDAKVMSARYQADEKDLNSALKNEGDADESATGEDFGAVVDG